MNKQNKLARNAIRARKAQKKRVNEQDKPKKGKRWLTRIFSLLGCLLLVSALVVPCFADETETQDGGATVQDSATIFEDAKRYFYEFYGLGTFSPLRALMDSDVFDSNIHYTYEFQAHPVEIAFRAPVLMSVNIIDPLSLSYVCVTDNTTGEMIQLMPGAWGTTFYTSGDNRFWFLDFEEYVETDTGLTTRKALRYRVKFNKDTFQVSEVSLQSDFYDIDFADTGWTVGTITDKFGKLSLEYADSCNYALFAVSDNYRTFERGFAEGYHDGESVGYTNGYDVGYDEGEQYGYDWGYATGEVRGYQTGWGDGYNDGYTKGVKDTEADEEGQYKKGYYAAVSEIDSGKFGENFLGNMFSAPIRALEEFTLAKLPDGTNITILGVLSAFVALTLFIAFLKKFAGG